MVETVETVDLSHTVGLYYGPATISKGKVLHISGQPGNTNDGYVPDDYESQIHLCLFNLRKLIIAAGANIEHIAKLCVYIVNYDATNRKHAKPIQRFFGRHRPAQTLVPVPKLAVPSWLIEIDATIALPDPSLPPTLPTASEAYDIVIIGAGLAGLSAAHEVRKAGYSCVVLESRDRVGGKTWSQPLGDGAGIIDVGAGWINDTNQSRVYELAQRYGAETIVQNTEGNCVLQSFDGSCSTFPYGELPNVSRIPPLGAHESLWLTDACSLTNQQRRTSRRFGIYARQSARRWIHGGQEIQSLMRRLSRHSCFQRALGRRLSRLRQSGHEPCWDSSPVISQLCTF